MFLIARVGNGEGAKKFVNDLETDEELTQMVFCSKDALDPSRAVFKRGEKEGYGYSKYVSLSPLLICRNESPNCIASNSNTVSSYYSFSWLV